MLGTTDWAGIAACITALFGGIAAVVSAVIASKVHSEVKNPNGSKTGIAIEEVHAAVMTPPGKPTLGVTASDTNDKITDEPPS